MKYCISTYATKRYAYALPNLGRRITACISYAKIKKGIFIFVGDGSGQIKNAAEKYIKAQLPESWKFVFLPALVDDAKINYKEDAQLLIAQMQGLAFSYARKNRVKYFWSVESDVLPSVNSLQCLLNVLKFDNGYYSVAMGTYPSQGGGSYLGGRGTPLRHIETDYTLEERKVPLALSKKITKIEKILTELEKKSLTSQLTEKEWNKLADNRKQLSELHKEAEKYPPIDNVFALNGKKWKRRGWMDAAYPGIGKGAILPTDWVGFGNTLLNKKALDLAHFDGYEGFGTQDLYIGWNRWIPEGLRLCVVPHCASDHIIRQRNKEGDQDFEKIIAINAYHEMMGDFYGHLRQRPSVHYKMIEGEEAIKREEPPEDKTE